ncbi:MAG: 23S rRNA (uracil(1939)-C(5))-methyltransferase RlmD [Clostridia bacterium]|nr:23S rRNA (uracil(1939)-C(5))-methyltransferase RlmD [Clostridia bacterium]
MDELRKNQTYTAEITGYTSSGAGVARICGRAVFVDFAIFGELWEILIVKVSASAVYGKGIRLIRPSPERREPECPAFGKCGGCDLMHMSYDEELRLKLMQVNDAIRHVGGLDFEIGEILGAENIFRYRNKSIYNFAEDGGRAVAGFFRERTHDVVPVGDCLIQTELSSRCSAALCEFMNDSGIPVYDEVSGKGLIRRLFTRSSLKYPNFVAVIVAAGGLGKHTATLVDALRKACPELNGIVLCINKTRGNTVLDGAFHTLWGSEFIVDELCGLKFEISPMSFFQINPKQAEKLYDRAVNYACPDGGTVLDLYCGAGTISLCLARKAEKVYGAEIVEQAVENARINARENGIENAEFFLGDAGEAAEMFEKAGVKPDAVVVDPPRKGLSAQVIDSVAAMSPERVVYVSCDPGTLARDMKLFAEKGYVPKSGAAVDMFPRTAHVETIVGLYKKD